ncbi:transporter substrate-binding domain-containing protein [Bradyrhizobium sp. CIR3A]|uniref:transporter substrate-binding domain-containing protein n=1 Tax=Bradyrhizobium sp. CIR3A TaxID=2663838 RepID=UPI00160608E0|nr:transporter substrate-binding domain-containing protein [Bradyrhizobium sp. CIR3A]MBB4264257.1 polar amino acid transport system substrate-binding protein [Bradyrhizobium sp. CIR3A]
MRAKQLALSLFLTVGVGSGATAIAAQDDPLFVKIREAGEVRVGVAPSPPYMMLSPSGEATGVAVEMNRLILKAMGLPKMTPVFLEWSAVFPALDARQIDYVGGQINIVDDRCQKMALSTPMTAAHLALFVLPNNPKQLTSIDDVARNPSLKISVVQPYNSAYGLYAKSLGVTWDQMVGVPEHQAGIASVLGGRTDAYLAAAQIPDPEKNGVKLVVDEKSPIFANAAAFRIENKAFRDAYNEHALRLIKDGTYKQLWEKFGAPYADVTNKLLTSFSSAGDIAPACK